MNRYLSYILFLNLLCWVSCKESKTAEGPNSSTTAVRAMTADGYIVKESTLSESVSTPGNIIPFESTDIQSEVSGRITFLNIKEGATVPSGFLLASVNDEELQARLKKLKIQLQIAQNTEKRQSELLQIKGIGQQEYEMSLLELNNLKADIEIIASQIEKTKIKAPYAGRLGLRSISFGAYITPQTILTTISQVNQLKLEFLLNEKNINKIKIGDPIQFTCNGSNKIYKARIIAMETGIEINSRSLKVRALVENNDGFIKPGNFANVLFEFDPNNKALMIPTQAVIPQARDKKVIVYKGGNVVFQKVILGMRDSSKIQIVSGLSVGDTILISGLLSIKPNSKVALNPLTE